jgi:hypothetical protein
MKNGPKSMSRSLKNGSDSDVASSGLVTIDMQ